MRTIPFVLLSLFTSVTLGQNNDLKEIDELVHGMYTSISFNDGKINENPDYDRTYYKNAQIGMIDTAKISLYSIKDFDKQNNKVFKKNNVESFQEKELKGITHFYGGVAMRFSSYEYVIKLPNREIKAQGINSIQLVKDPISGWKIFSILFSDNHTFSNLPKKYIE